MKKSTRIVKRGLALFLIVLMSINTFGAVVGDNDGSAFITKAEFDSLKNNFQSQIDQYNTSIDSKIDGAIASYLAGIKMDRVTTKKSIWEQFNERRTLRFYQALANLQDMNEDNIRLGYCVKFIWAYLMNGSIFYTNNYTGTKPTTTNFWAGNNFWFPISTTHDRRFGLTWLNNAVTKSLKGERVSFNGSTWFVSDSSVYSHFYGTVSIYGNSNEIRDTPSIEIDKPHGHIVWPHFDYDLQQYLTNTSTSATYTINLGPDWPSVSIPVAINIVWKSEETSVENPLYYFNNGATDITLEQMTLDNNRLINWTKADELRFPYSYQAGEIWPTIALSETSDGRVAMWQWGDRNYTAGQMTPGASNVTPPNYSGSTGTPPAWIVEWESTEDNRVRYMRPECEKLPVSKITNKTIYDILNIPITSYNGVPITMIDSAVSGMSFKLDVSVHNLAGATLSNQEYYLIVSDQAFDETSSSTLIASGDTEHIKMFRLNTNSNPSNITLDPNWCETLKKDSYVYGRVYSTTTDTYAEANIVDLVLTSNT